MTRTSRIFVLLFFFTAGLFAQSGALKVPDAEQFVGSPKGLPMAPGPQLEQRTTEVASLLRCPVCQGLSIADSPSEMAVNMKGQVKELLSRGFTQEQILKYFELSYGQFVLLKPKFQGVNSLVWILPIAVLLIGIAVVFTKINKLKSEPVVPPTTDHQLPTTPPSDDPYLAKVRDLVAGAKD